MKVDWKRSRPSQTVPDQSMSVDEIVKRYVRGVPVDLAHHEKVYYDQEEMDLEKVSRLDFDQKAELAAEISARREAMIREARERKAEAQRKAKSEQTERKEPPSPGDSAAKNPAEKPE